MFPWAYYGYGGHLGTWWWSFMFVGMLVPLAVVVLLVWLVVRALQGRPAGNPGRDDPLQILKVRYAKGEVTREEYLRMKEELEA